MIFEKIENEIKKLDGVIGCKVVGNNEKDITEIHLLTYDKRNPKQISRDVETLLLSMFEISIDYKIISIAQVKDDSIVDESKRLVIQGMSNTIEDNKINVKVQLKKEEKTFIGENKGFNITNSIQKMFAEDKIATME